MPIYRIVVIVLLALASVVISAPARADISLRIYQKWSNEVESQRIKGHALEVYLIGLLEGINWTLTEYSDARIQPIYCLPAKQRFGTSDLKAVIDEELAARPHVWKDPETPVALAAIVAMRRKFPCA